MQNVDPNRIPDSIPVPPDEKSKPDITADNSIENGVSERKDKDLPRHVAQDAEAPGNDLPEDRPEEHGGQAGLEPTRYGDWEKKGRCTDF
ncbi:MAG: DUF1674 domain-containing protein [Granulosicoccus sp.]